MLQEIIDSKYKSVIVPFLLLATARSYSVPELSKRLGISTAKLNDELSDLMKLGLVRSFTKNRQTYFLINTRHKSLIELKQSLVKNQKHFDDELFLAIKRLGDVQGAFLSGIFTGKPELPVDILIVGKPNLNKLDEFLQNCKKMMGQDVNYSIMSEDEYTLRRDTFDRFIKDVFDYPHLVVFDNLHKSKKKVK